MPGIVRDRSTKIGNPIARVAVSFLNQLKSQAKALQSQQHLDEFAKLIVSAPQRFV